MKKTEIVYKKTDDLIPYANNPRLNDDAVDAVAASIKEFGFKQPIVVDNENVIVVGHTRYKASKKLGLEQVPVIVASDLTPAQAKAYRLADNKVNEMASWDYLKVDLELEDIDLDMSEFGFEESNIEWADVEDLSEENFTEPTIEMLQCPACHHIDSRVRFKPVKKETDENIPKCD